MDRSIVISGYLYDISDNIIPFIENSDVYVHTWASKENDRWIKKLNRYKKYCNELYVTVDENLIDEKIYSYFYSTWKAFNSIKHIDKYDLIIKLKPNLDTQTIKYKGRVQDYFHKAQISNRPLLDDYTYRDCLYGSIYYKTLDERLFSGHPLAFRKIFNILEEDLKVDMFRIHTKLKAKYGDDYEGSLFWKEWFDYFEVPIIQDTDLILPNNKRNQFEKY